MITEERLEDIKDMFWTETNEDWTREWREDLTDEEASLVDEWDDAVDRGFYKLAKRIIELSEKRRSGKIP